MSYKKNTYSKKEPELPVKIHRIEVQKKNSYRYSLHSESGFITGISDSTLTKHNLKKGSIIDAQLYHALSEDEERWSIKEYLIRLLGRRDHASHELRLKGMKKGYDSDILDEIISDLEDNGYVNNLAFAKKYAHDKFIFNEWGPNKIRIELIKKQIDKLIIEDVLNEEINHNEVVESIERLVFKKKPSLLRVSEEKRKKKIFDYLVRKGYEPNIILKSIDNLLEIISKN